VHARLVPLMLLSGVALSACTSFRAYEGKQQKTEAVLRARSTYQDFILELDDQEMPARCWEVYCLPGHHLITARITWVNGFIEDVSLGFEAKAGRSYSLSTSTAPIGNFESGLDWVVIVGTFGQGSMPPNRRTHSRAALGRPRHGFCAIWIYDEATREVAGGVPPAGWHEETARRRAQLAESEASQGEYLKKKEWGQ